MRRIHILPFLLLTTCAAGSPCAQAQSAGDARERRIIDTSIAIAPVEDLRIIPRPASVVMRSGVFTLSGATRILYPEGHARLKEIAEDLRDAIASEVGIRMRTSGARMKADVNRDPSARGDARETGVANVPASERDAIVLRVNPLSSGNPESHSIEITPDRLTITAPGPEGVFLATQSLRQLALAVRATARGPVSEAGIPCARIDDIPQFGWRGLLLDCCRHFMSKDYVKRTIDLIALHKMNRLHWHLTDDQGWRIDIRTYPRLTSVGSRRIDNDGTRHDGYYSQADIREVVEYARRRGVTVVPEIEMPGHALAALAAYPQLSCTGGPFQVATTWGVFKDIFCAGNDSTFTVLDGVLDEVCALFPSPWIHIGGDEAPTFQWEHCAKCQARMKAEALESEQDLQGWFIRRIAAHLKSLGRTIIGWDEMVEGGLAPDAMVQSWRGMEGAVDAARAGHSSIVSPTSHAYFDYDVRSIPLEKVYAFNPIPEELEPRLRAHIRGGECNLWSEYAPQEKVDSRVYPRLLAMAEVLWTPAARRVWDEFHARVQEHYRTLDLLGVTYGYEAPPVRFLPVVLREKRTVEVTLAPGQPGLDLRCTADGSDPARARVSCPSPLRITLPTTIRAIAVRAVGAHEGSGGEEYQLRVEPHAALGAAVSLAHAYSAWYTGGGPGALTDGVRGSDDFRDGHWQGTEGAPLEAVIDLGTETSVHTIEAGFLQFMPAWIFMPDSVEFQISNSGTDWRTVGIARNTIPQMTDKRVLHTFSTAAGAGAAGAGATAHTARYVRVRARGVEVCPDWHPGAGGKAWIFADEIVVR